MSGFRAIWAKYRDKSSAGVCRFNQRLIKSQLRVLKLREATSQPVPNQLLVGKSPGKTRFENATRATLHPGLDWPLGRSTAVAPIGERVFSPNFLAHSFFSASAPVIRFVFEWCLLCGDPDWSARTGSIRRVNQTRPTCGCQARPERVAARARAPICFAEQNEPRKDNERTRNARKLSR